MENGGLFGNFLKVSLPLLPYHLKTIPSADTTVPPIPLCFVCPRPVNPQSCSPSQSPPVFDIIKEFPSEAINLPVHKAAEESKWKIVGCQCCKRERGRRGRRKLSSLDIGANSNSNLPLCMSFPPAPASGPGGVKSVVTEVEVEFHFEEWS